ncbi:hypothetical protein T4B_14159 [Trichinella pseudospiralis]|uniref:Uncharacterized protein n=1 Tax=Trichinella pseudospiralis TaxID=6337 RepID=A0A0V1GJV4_TRIPS|nr:hypothetical protein T4B_14159 [Trichinella pseudospiralis]
MDAKCDCQNPRDLAALQTSFPRISESRMASHLHLIFPPFGSSFVDYTTSYVVRRAALGGNDDFSVCRELSSGHYSTRGRLRIYLTKPSQSVSSLFREP